MSFWLHESRPMVMVRFLTCTQKGIITLLLVLFPLLAGLIAQHTFFIRRERALQDSLLLYKGIEQKQASMQKKIQEHTQSLGVMNAWVKDHSLWCTGDGQVFADRWIEAMKLHDLECKMVHPGQVYQKDGCIFQSFDVAYKGLFKNVKTFIHDFYDHNQVACSTFLMMQRHKNHRVKGTFSISFLVGARNGKGA